MAGEVFICEVLYLTIILTALRQFGIRLIIAAIAVSAVPTILLFQHHPIGLAAHWDVLGFGMTVNVNH